MPTPSTKIKAARVGASPVAPGPKQIGVDHQPTPALERTILEVAEGDYAVYDSPEAVTADIEHHRRRPKR